MAIAMSLSPNVHHQRTGLALLRLLADQVEDTDYCHCQVIYEHDWRVSEFTVFRPDIMIVCEEFEGEWVNVPPTLIVEILSPSSEEQDRHHKRRFYEDHGVKHYLLVHPASGEVEAFTLGHDGLYNRVVESEDGSGHTLPLHDNCLVTIPKTISG